MWREGGERFLFHACGGEAQGGVWKTQFRVSNFFLLSAVYMYVVASTVAREHKMSRILDPFGQFPEFLVRTFFLAGRGVWRGFSGAYVCVVASVWDKEAPTHANFLWSTFFRISLDSVTWISLRGLP